MDRVGDILPANIGFIGSDCKLVVLPEYWMTGFPMGVSFSEWAQFAAIAPEGPAYERLGELAQSNRIYLAGNSY